MRVKDKIALVTGAASGIGKATAQLLAQEGARVAIADLDAGQGRAVADSICQGGGEATFRELDVSEEAGVRAWVGSVAEEWGGIDILVNNAAAFVFGTVEEATNEDWDRVLSVNVKGYAFCAKYAVPEIRKRGGGSIVNVASISGFVAQPAFVPYNSSKGAVVQLTRCMALDLGQDNIRVNCVCPGCIDTPATVRHANFTGVAPEDLMAEAALDHLLKRVGQPIEVARAILFLASDEASFITGHPLFVDGGQTAH